MITLVQARRLVRARMGVPMSDDFFTNDVINDHINLAIDEVNAEQHWPWLEALDSPSVDSDNLTITVPDDYTATRTLMVNDFELTEVSPGDLLMSPADNHGQPDSWAQIGGVLQVSPVPDGAYTLTHVYYRSTPWLVADYDTVPIPAPYSGAVISKACALLSHREDDRTAAAAHIVDYQSAIARMRRAVRLGTRPSRPRVRPGGWI